MVRVKPGEGEEWELEVLVRAGTFGLPGHTARRTERPHKHLHSSPRRHRDSPGGPQYKGNNLTIPSNSIPAIKVGGNHTWDMHKLLWGSGGGAHSSKSRTSFPCPDRQGSNEQRKNREI